MLDIAITAVKSYDIIYFENRLRKDLKNRSFLSFNTSA